MTFYTSKPSYDKHCERWELLGRLHDLNPKKLSAGANILELGCGIGNNILPIALNFPKSKFLGVDISTEQIAIAKADAETLKLSNIAFKKCDILDLCSDEAFLSQKYSYIMVHGLLSWVDEKRQKAVFEICSKILEPDGICYISYNVMPSFEVREFLREIVRTQFTYTPNNISDVRNFLLNYDLGSNHLPFQAERIHFEINNILKQSDEYIFYELIYRENHAFFFDDIIKIAQDVGISYICDVNRFTELDERENDFLEYRPYRASLFCLYNKDGAKERLLKNEVNIAILKECYAATKLVYEEDSFGNVYFYDMSGEKVQVYDDGVIKILKSLVDAWPFAQMSCNSFNYEQLKELWYLFSQKLVDFYLEPVDALINEGVSCTRLQFNPYARLQLERQNWATNYRNEYNILTEREIIIARLLDGGNSVTDIIKIAQENYNQKFSEDEVKVIIEYFRECAVISKKI